MSIYEQFSTEGYSKQHGIHERRFRAKVRYHAVTEVKEQKKLKIERSQMHQRRREAAEMALTSNALNRSALKMTKLYTVYIKI